MVLQLCMGKLEIKGYIFQMSSQSIVLTIHNKQDVIKKVIKGIYNNTSEPYELIIVFDGCTDNSEKIVKKFFTGYFKKKIKVTYLYADNIYETKANNIGLKACSGDLVTIIQDDIVINEKEWNLNLAKPFEKYNDVFSVTAHTSHNLEYVPPKDEEIYGEYYMLKFPDPVGFRTHKQEPSRSLFHIRLTSNRGPLMINHESLVKLNYLDEIFSPQTWDDHDLNIRARINLGLVTGYYPISFISDLRWGSTRDNNGKEKEWSIRANQKNSLIIYERYKEEIKQKIVETRKI